MVTSGKPTPRNPGPHDGSLMGNEQVSRLKRTGSVCVGALYRSQSRILIGASKSRCRFGQGQLQLPPAFHLEEVSSCLGRRKKWMADVNSLGDFHGYEPIFCEKRGGPPIRIFNRCHALCVRVHVLSPYTKGETPTNFFRQLFHVSFA